MDRITPLVPDSVVVRSGGLLEAEIDNEIVALNVANGMCYGLNRVGSQVWRMLVRPIRVSELCATLVEQYEVDQQVCERQVIDLLEELRAEHLIGIMRS
jgi:Coenzyme PQQ synthesis protein D (PqqD)